jgi:hypothetical protein
MHVRASSYELNEILIKLEERWRRETEGKRIELPDLSEDRGVVQIVRA